MVSNSEIFFVSRLVIIFDRNPKCDLISVKFAAKLGLAKYFCKIETTSFLLIIYFYFIVFIIINCGFNSRYSPC